MRPIPHAEILNIDLRLAAQNPQRVDIWVNIASSQMALGDPEGALESLDRAHRLDPNHALVYASRAMILSHKRDWRESRPRWTPPSDSTRTSRMPGSTWACISSSRARSKKRSGPTSAASSSTLDTRSPGRTGRSPSINSTQRGGLRPARSASDDFPRRASSGHHFRARSLRPGRPRRCTPRFKACLDLRPEDAASWVGYRDVLVKLGAIDAATAAQGAALGAGPRDTFLEDLDALTTLRAVSRRRRRGRAGTSSPRAPSALSRASRLEDGEVAAAARWMQRALEEDPSLIENERPRYARIAVDAADRHAREHQDPASRHESDGARLGLDHRGPKTCEAALDLADLESKLSLRRILHSWSAHPALTDLEGFDTRPLQPLRERIVRLKGLLGR